MKLSWGTNYNYFVRFRDICDFPLEPTFNNVNVSHCPHSVTRIWWSERSDGLESHQDITDPEPLNASKNNNYNFIIKSNSFPVKILTVSHNHGHEDTQRHTKTHTTALAAQRDEEAVSQSGGQVGGGDDHRVWAHSVKEVHYLQTVTEWVAVTST